MVVVIRAVLASVSNVAVDVVLIDVTVVFASVVVEVVVTVVVASVVGLVVVVVVVVVFLVVAMVEVVLIVKFVVVSAYIGSKNGFSIKQQAKTDLFIHDRQWYKSMSIKCLRMNNFFGKIILKHPMDFLGI